MAPTPNANISNFLKNFERSFEEMQKSVQKNEWVFDYDEVSDILYFSPKNKAFAASSVLVPAGDTYVSVRVAVDGGIEAIVIENFGSMFVPENSEFQRLYNQLTGKAESVEPITFRRARVLILSELGSALSPQAA